MKRIIKGISSFIVLLLLIAFSVSTTDSMQVRTLCKSIDELAFLEIGDLSFSNVSMKIVDSKCRLNGSIVNSSAESVNYTVDISYYDKQFDGNVVASSEITGTAKSGKSDFNHMSKLNMEGHYSVDDIKAYILTVRIDSANTTVPSSSSVSRESSIGSSRDYEITKYDVNMIVNENNTFDVTETITAYFNKSNKHGLIRKIPLKNNIIRADGTASTNRAKVYNLSVNNKYTTAQRNGNAIIRIGDENAYVISEQTYVIKYTYDIGADPVKTYDELYYNIIGDGWDTTISNVTFKITMPKEFDASKLGFSSGLKGSTENSKVKYEVSGNTITGRYDGILNAKEALTVRCELPEGYFVREAFEKDPLLICLMFIVPILALLITVLLWYKFARNDRVVDTVEFYPPKGLNSLDVGFLYRGRAKAEDVASLIVYLANKGYIKICDVGEKEYFKLIKLKAYDGNDKNEKKFLDDLFGEGKTSVTSDDLEKKFHKKVKKLLSRVNCKENIEKVFKKVSWKMITVLCCLMFISAITTFIIPTIEYIDYEIFNITLWSYIFGVLLLLVLDVLIAFSVKIKDFCAYVVVIGYLFFLIFRINDTPISIAMDVDVTYLIGGIIGFGCLIGMLFIMRLVSKRRTEYGSEMLGKLKGFKRFLKTAEKEKLENMIMKDPTYFYDILPYTYVLGVSSKWIEKFETISMREPSWYGSTVNNTFNFASFSSFVNSTQDTMSSYSSGGGSSGGGSGGGGGSSW